MDLYLQKMKERGHSDYIIDGAINESVWLSQNLRILFFLKETYGYQGCDPIVLGEVAKGWVDAKIKTYQNIAKLSILIHSSFSNNSSDTDFDLNDTESLKSILDRIAVINIKKNSGFSKSNDSEIRNESRMNYDLLKHQILELCPSIIITGGSVCWDSLIIDLGLYDIKSKVPKNSYIIDNNTVLYHSNHPAARGTAFNINQLHNDIVAAYKSII